jgi:phage major head subunit gpT-like protein
MPQTSADWADALAPGIREWFSIGYQNRPSLMGQLYNVLPSGSAEEFFYSFGAVAPDAWDDFEKSGRVPKVGFDKGYKSTFTHKEKIVELDVQRKFIDDNKYPQVTADATSLGSSAALKRELDAAGLFINAASSSFTGGDGVALCDDSHPVSPTKSATTQDNKDALTLTAANVETVRQKMLTVKDDTGNIMGVQPDLLVVNSALENDAKIITQTPDKTGSADNDLNPQYGRFRYLVWPLLTSATQWFMVDSVLMKQSLYWFDRVGVDVRRKQQDETIFATFIGYMRYSYGWRDWRWINRGNA